jgi:hypothetical protein
MDSRLFAAALAAGMAITPALAQSSLVAPRPSGPDPQDDLGKLLTQRQQEVARQQQQSFDTMQRQLEADRKGSLPVLPTDPDYRGSLLGR